MEEKNAKMVQVRPMQLHCPLSPPLLRPIACWLRWILLLTFYLLGPLLALLASTLSPPSPSFQPFPRPLFTLACPQSFSINRRSEELSNRRVAEGDVFTRLSAVDVEKKKKKLQEMKSGQESLLSSSPVCFSCSLLASS